MGGALVATMKAPIFSAVFVMVLVQPETSPVIAIAVIVGMLATARLSMVSALRSRRMPRLETPAQPRLGFAQWSEAQKARFHQRCSPTQFVCGAAVLERTPDPKDGGAVSSLPARRAGGSRLSVVERYAKKM
jgi:hypothetical protein